MSEQERKTRKRGSLKASLTNFTKYVELKQKEILEKGKEHAFSETDIIQLQDRLTRIENIYREFCDIQDDIEADVALDNLDEQYTERSIFEESYFAITAIAKSILEKYAPKKEDDNVSAYSSRSGGAQSNANSNTNFNIGGVKLPVIPLPKFQGSFQNWLEYKETFQSLVHESESLSPIQKYHYLRASLEGSAAQVLKSIEFSAAGYTVAWQTLNDRYNNTKLLVHNHIKVLFTLENIQKESSSKIRKLVDDVSKHLRSLEQLGQRIENWDPLLIFMITSKLDQITLGEWEKYSVELDKPTLESLKTFLKNRADFLETLEYKTNVKTSGQDSKQSKRDDKYPRYSSKSLNATAYSCYYCKKEHSIYACNDFNNLSVNKRTEFINRAKLCLNCLRQHPGKKCRMGPCKKCHSWHNSLLHQEDGPIEPASSQNNEEVTINDSKSSPSEISLSSGVGNHSLRTVLLSTARVRILDKWGRPHIARALLDSGSMSSFITTELCDRLELDKVSTNLDVFGISNAVSKVRKKCNITLSSLHRDFNATLTCFILPEITNITPGFEIDVRSLDIPSNLNLADDEFNKPGAIDILIGCDLFWNLLRSDRISCGKNNPILQDTELGWVVSGQLGGTQVKGNKGVTTCNLSTNQDLQNSLSKFWEIEEFSSNKPLTKDEIECEKIFQETTRRDADGRFIVTLPLKESADGLGESRSQAEKMFYNTERKLLKNQDLREKYVAFMEEYEALNHMTVVKSDSKPEYFMPHHGVLRDNSLSTKLRVVFNASSPSSNGLSLNNIQYVGPVLQEDLLSIILRFRQKRYVVSADCKMMYRQILVDPGQRNLQKIFWRASPTEELKTYALNTVTYGHASASFLAIRCLFELANESADSNPEIADIIKRCFYVDDLLFSTDSVEHAQYICQEIINVLKSGCFELRKWYSNEPKILENIETNDISCGILEFGPNEKAKTLGLTWSCHSDKLLYAIDDFSNEIKVTKRSVLSITARIFDPLGLLSPCTIIAKMLMQKLWSEKISWDEQLPIHLASEWHKFKSDLPSLNLLAIERHVVCKRVKKIELHGFSDASERAYGACLYVRSTDEDGDVHVNLLCAKSKVAPIKTLSIPRLELCAALLLARLSDKAKKSLDLKFDNCFYWTDSTITLAWIQTSPNMLKSFVGTRVSTIQVLTENQQWRHVPTQDNPADYVSRGLYPSQVIDSHSWWHGPQFLKFPSSDWPTLKSKIDEVPELKSPSTTAIPTKIDSDFPFERFSSYLRMKRVTAYILRFKDNCLKPASNRKGGPLSTFELNYAEKSLVRIAQRQSFPSEFSELLKNRSLDSKSKFFSLTPYLDQDGIIRVGGRLELSDFSPDKKHPIVLDSKNHLTKLLFAYEHIRLLHAGPQLLLSTIRDKFWPISGRNLARATVRKCIRCFRFKPEFVQPVMANLPRDRTVPSAPFHVTGLDYAGPFLVKRGLGKGRNCKLEKCYVGVFVCFSTKALHLELISSLSTESFLQALRRFVSRRGKPSKICSDNGKTFVGANRELKRFIESTKNDVKSTLANDGIDWQFICPYSPHMGGLWESGVKSVKYHLKRVLANAHLSFEEFTTSLAQIEAILNSRPICPISSDPNNLSPLTPAHFLVGRPLVAVPDESLQDLKLNRLTRFQLVQRICQHFWQRWQRDYISELQLRQKWRTNQGQLSEGLLVLIKDDQTLPTEWRLGRIVAVHKGADGVARIASIQTSTGVVKRSFPKICPLPLEN